jgi:SAM-dependent methyltransferase
MKNNINSNFTNSEYANIFDWFTNNSNHERNIVKNIKQLISNKKITRTCLDIGTGNGNISKHITPLFDNMTLLEPNKEYIRMYNGIKYDSLISLDFLNYETDLKYDVILCSHVLYHVPVHLWQTFIEKMYNMLNDDGVCIIVHVTNYGEMHELRKLVNPEYHNSKTIVDIVQKLQYIYDIIPIDSILSAVGKDYEKFKFLVELFTIDDCFEKEYLDNVGDKKYIYNHINNYIPLLKKNNTYSANFNSDIIVINK